jgi:hypothetical protein
MNRMLAWVSPNSGLQPTWPAALLPSELCHHGVAGHAAEPWSVRRQKLMKFFTMEWWAGDDDSDQSQAYAEHLQHLESRLPPNVRRLASASFHDAALRELRVTPSSRELTMRLDLPDSSVTNLTYHDLQKFISTGSPDSGLSSPGGFGDFGYDEIDQAEDGAFVHRILFSNGIEFEIVFRDVSGV